MPLLGRIFAVASCVLALACNEVRERIVYVQCDAGSRPDEVEADMDGSIDAPDSGENEVDAASDAGSEEPWQGECPPLRSRTIIDVPGGVLKGAQIDWSCDNIYVLNGIVFVHSGEPGNPQVLRIQAG